MAGAERPLEGVNRQPEKHLVQHNRCQFAHVVVLCQIDQMAEGQHVLLKVGIGIPLAKTARSPLSQP